MATLRQAQGKLLTLQVSRTPPTAAGDRWQSFDVPYAGQSMSLLDGLIWIQRNSDPTLAFRCACRVGMCGTCGVVVNGREGLACRTMARDLLDGGARVEPMRHMPVVRDLVTDGSAFYAKLRQVSPGAPDPSDGARLAVVDPDTPERKAVELQRECIYCGLCYSACTVAGLDEDFLGPAALNRAFLTILDGRVESADETLDAVANERGLWRCHTMFECAAVCPKGISPTLAIQQLKRRVIGRKLKRLFLR